MCMYATNLYVYTFLYGVITRGTDSLTNQPLPRASEHFSLNFFGQVGIPSDQGFTKLKEWQEAYAVGQIYS